jgi:type I restriction enzyme S subunit
MSVIHDWYSATVGCYVELINGYAFSSDGFTESEGMPLIRIRDLNRCETEVNFLGKYSERYVVNKGDLLIGMDGDFLTIRWKGNNALLNQRVCKLVTKDREKLTQGFLFYRIVEEINAIHRITAATTVKHLSSKDVLEIEIKLPSKPEQSKIAEILSTVDRAIEQTEGLIAKQQRIKTGLMQDLLTRGIDEHGNLRSEETHEFKDSPLRRIPVEWEVSRLSDLASVDRGKFTHRPRDDVRFYGGPFPFIQTGDVTSHVGRTVNSYTQTLSVKGTKVSKEFPKGTIAITIAANIADTAILGQPMFFPDSVVGSVVVEPYSIRYIELAIRRWKPTLERMAPQSAQRNINLEVLRPLLIATPSPNEQIQIAEIYERAESAHMQLEETHEKLCSLKTALMQDLLTGKVRVTPLLEKKEVQ